MLWPIGQPFGELRDLAKKSLGIWLEVLAASGLWHDRAGSLHLAYRDDEAQVLQEFAQQSLENGERVDLLDPAQVRRPGAGRAARRAAKGTLELRGGLRRPA